MRPAAAVLAALALLAPPRPAAAAAEPPRPLEYHLAVDLGITLGAALASALMEGPFRDRLEPPTCRWCATNGFDDAFRTALRWSDGATANTLSNVGEVVVPVGMLAYLGASAWAGGEPRAGLVDALIVAEAAAIATLLDEIVKFSTARARPYAAHGLPEPPHARPGQTNLSFYSGHTTFAFAVAVAGATVAYQRGYAGAPIALGVGLAAATFVGWMRIAADMHFATDVLAGAAIGSAVGYAVARWMHPPRDAAAPRVSAAPGGIAVAF